MPERPVPVRWLLGPAGAGKTYRCLEEARTALRRSADGLPLLFLAPKQATFQLERQLLADADLPGYTRLHILSFERLAEWILRRCRAPTRPLLAETGRVMVLRALLSRARADLLVFRATARLPGFARHLSDVLRELEHHHVSPARLRQAAAQAAPHARLQGKLLDLAQLAEQYHDWLEARQLEDSARLFRLAREALEPSGEGAETRLAASSSPLPSGNSPGERTVPDGPASRDSSRRGGPLPAAEPWFGACWLDGFAEMTPAEIDLVAAVVPRCERATLAFCLERPAVLRGDWLSPWSLVGRTQAALRGRLACYPGITSVDQWLRDASTPTRFSASPAMGHLERHWSDPRPFAGDGPAPSALPIRVVRCANPEAEAIVAARAVVQFVRDECGRYRDAAVLVRSLDAYQAVVRRVFARYQIPIFLDRREGVAHHPLAELIRAALRLVAFGWRTEDWMSVLKTGLAGGDENAVDALENAALAAGWEGETWLEPFSPEGEGSEAARFESLRRQLVSPFAALTNRLGNGAGVVSGRRLTEAIRQLCTELDVRATLSTWSQAALPVAPGASMAMAGHIHGTVWQDLNALFADLALAFKDEAVPLREWLAIVEAGLSNLTVGVVPPSLDQVLVGAVDRSRNPDLRLVVLLGWNDGVFPAPLPTPPLLNEAERRNLETMGVSLGPDRRRRIGRERYYAYIACTRGRDRLVVTFAERDAEDRSLNPSPLLRSFERLFPRLTQETAVTRPEWAEIEHACEAVVPWWRHLQRTEQGPGLPAIPGLAQLPELPRVPLGADLEARLLPALADRLYGPGVLRTSVSRLEQFAACPFRFFVHSGLRAEERRVFEADVRQTGSFQHEVLACFHAELTARGQRWRDLTPAEAREHVGRIAERLSGEFAHGLFRADAQRRFAARALASALQDFVEVSVRSMRSSYAFDPAGAEQVFGASDGGLPAWEVVLPDGHRLLIQGKIDRIDLAPIAGGDEALCVVIDYKSSAHKVDQLLLEHGIQIQLPTYLAALRTLNRHQPLWGVTRLVPVGMFYANLRPGWERKPDRAAASAGDEGASREAYRHRGRFRLDALPSLDRLWDQPVTGGQFSYARGGKPNRRYSDPLPASDFNALLDRVEETVREIGRQIFAGEAWVAPFLKGTSESACRTCLYQTVCRFDPWLHEYRRLAPSPSPAS